MILKFLPLYLCMLYTLANAKQIQSLPKHNPIEGSKILSRKVRSVNVQCSATWNITTQRFDVTSSWSNIGNAMPPYTVTFFYPQASALINTKMPLESCINTYDDSKVELLSSQMNGDFIITCIPQYDYSTINTFFCFSYAPIVSSATAELNVLSTPCFVDLTLPMPSPITVIHIISYKIVTTSLVEFANITDLYVNWSIPISPTGNISDLVYEIRIGGNETMLDAANVHVLINGDTTTDQSFQKGSVDINDISVSENFTHLYFQIRSYYNITLNGESQPLIISNWSPSQSLSREQSFSVSSSTVTTYQSTATTMITSSLTTSTSQSSVVAITDEVFTPSTSQSSVDAITDVVFTTSTSQSSVDTTVFQTPLTTSSPVSTITANSGVEQVQVIAIIVGVALALILLVVVLLIIGICICFSLKRKRKSMHIESETMELKISKDSYSRESSPQIGLDRWEIPSQHVHKIRCIGEGVFGNVYEGVVRGFTNTILDMHIQRSNHNHSVAVKVLKDEATELDKEQFLKEISLMKKISEFSNPHVINLVGASTLDEPMLLLTEFMQYGDLLGYLKACRDGNMYDDCISQCGKLEESDIPSFAYQIASGMEYLASMGLVHRDLACRNILMGEGRKLKVSDFGLSRKLNLESMYVTQTEGRFPVRWMAIESIVDRTFTTHSDVWSFGVTLWEIGSLGEIPYSFIGNDGLLSYIRNNQRLSKPDQYISEEVYSIMKDCWKIRPSDRPSFTVLRKLFDTMLSRNDNASQYYMTLQLNSTATLKDNTLTRSNMYVKVV